MILDFTDPDNKKHIPTITFVIGCAVGALLWKFYLEYQTKKMASGGSVNGGGNVAPAQTVIQVAPAAAAPPIAAPVSAAPIPTATVSSTPM